VNVSRNSWFQEMNVSRDGWLQKWLFLNILGANCCISTGFERSSVDNFGFMQILKGF
jgi:hypothetical protein